MVLFSILRFCCSINLIGPHSTRRIPRRLCLPQPPSFSSVCSRPHAIWISRGCWAGIASLSAPKVVAVDYLAFYQPASFGEQGGQVQYVAEMRGHELTTRAELLRDEPEHPRAREEYFKIQLGALERLKTPVKAEKWRRITFFYTTGEYLLRAKTLNDLVVNGDERKLLWHSLRERAENEQFYKTDLPEVDLPPEVLLALLGITEMQATYETKEQENDFID
jgi:hypothetical protein